nr:zinc finger protein 234 [Helicoverpa armigera]
MASFQSEIKIEELCRTCLSKDNELHSIFDVIVGTTTPLDYIITSTTGLKISKNDGLPSTICCECEEKAKKAYDFKKKSEEANMSLRGILKKECSLMTKTLGQNNASSVKTEDLSSHENDDYVDSDFNISLNSGTDLQELEAVKTEHEILERKSCIVCKSCLVVFDTRDKLLDHQKICIKVECDETNRTFCPLCGTCYNGAENLTKHMWEFHADLMGPKKRGRPKKMLTSTILNKLSENGFCITSMPAKKIECAFCKHHFETKEELGLHAVTHKETKVLRCLDCKKIYLDAQKFYQHICIEDKAGINNVENDSTNTDSNNKKKQQIASEITLREFIDPNSDMEAINLLQVCSVCTCILQSESDLINHRDAEHPELSHRCNLCTKVFASLRSAARHRSMCKQIERKYKCNTCGLKFAYEISLNKHILRYHEGQSVSVKFIDPKTRRDERQFQCDTCSRSFYKRDLLVKHTKIHMPIENFYECDVCKKKFHRSDNLRSHKRVHDVHREKPSSNNCLCLYCGRSFSNSSNLIVHMRRHTGEKPYKCDFCGKGFPRSSDLQCHRRSHTGEKPCICRVCGKGFSRSNKLSRHMRVHTGQRPYKCTYCEKAFSQSNDLNLHIRRHTGDRPYICEVCGDRFIQGTALQNHRRAHGHFPAPPAEAPSEVQAITYTVQSINHSN